MLGNRVLHIGIFGANRRQLRPGLSGNARVVAVAGYPAEGLDPSIRAYGNLDELLADPEDAALPIPGDLPAPPYIAHYARFLLDGTPMPASLDEEMALHEAAATGAQIAVRYPDRDRR